MLPFLSRVFEKLVVDQLYEYLDKNKLIYYQQFGFRSLHSSVTCLLHSTNDWYVNMDKGRFTATVFINLKEAFDTVDHDILLQKLEMYGVIGLERTWFSSYLKNRWQLCRVNGVASNMEEIKCGVPQGSCLGPLLFFICINDLPISLKNSEVTMYADDTSISYSFKNIDELNETLNSDLYSLKQWLEGNKLSLDVIKTQAMVIGSRPNIKKMSDKSVLTPSFAIGNSYIDVVDNAKYLEYKLINILCGMSILRLYVQGFLALWVSYNMLKTCFQSIPCVKFIEESLSPSFATVALCGVAVEILAACSSCH